MECIRVSIVDDGGVVKLLDSGMVVNTKLVKEGDRLVPYAVVNTDTDAIELVRFEQIRVKKDVHGSGHEIQPEPVKKRPRYCNGCNDTNYIVKRQYPHSDVLCADCYDKCPEAWFF